MVSLWCEVFKYIFSRGPNRLDPSPLNRPRMKTLFLLLKKVHNISIVFTFFFLIYSSILMKRMYCSCLVTIHCIPHFKVFPPFRWKTYCISYVFRSLHHRGKTYMNWNCSVYDVFTPQCKGILILFGFLYSSSYLIFLP